MMAGRSKTGQRSAERVAVVGGGMLGMTVAARLAERSLPVTLYEAADHLGGLADAWTLGGVTWDRHYHVTLLSDTDLRRTLAQLGLDAEIRWVETKTGFYTDGQLYSMSNSWEFLRFPPLNFLDKIRLGATIFYASKIRNWRRLETIPVAEWLQRLGGESVWNKIWLPLLQSKLGDNYRKTSAAFIWATIARLYAARRTGLKQEQFGYVPGGYSRIVNAFQRRLIELGVRIELGRPLRKVAADRQGCTALEFADGQSARCSRVVLTVPAPATSALCPQLDEDEHDRLRSVEYQGIVCCSLLLKRGLSPYYVTNITDRSLPFTGVIEMTALMDPSELGRHALVYLPKYVPSDDSLFDRSDEEIADDFLSALARMHPQFRREDTLAFRVSRARHVMALSTLHYSQRVPRIRTSLPGVYVVNSAQIVNATLNVNETVKLAEQALQDVLLPDLENHQLHKNESDGHGAPTGQLVAGP